jgi:xanthine dehydrogenase YagS FAD-binding subunit
MKAFDYLVADELEPALDELADGKAMLKAGGVDLLDLMKERLETPEVVLSIDGIDELRYIREDGAAVRIGCLTTLADMARSDLIRTKYKGLHAAVADAATPQVRERATLGGNICQRPQCWYFRKKEFNCLKKGGPTCFAIEGENRYHAIFGGGPSYIVHPSNAAPALVALDAELVIRAADAQPRTIKAADFFVGPDKSLMKENVLDPSEIVSEIVLPAPPTASATVELREKQSFDWPLVMACVARIGKQWRVCLGAVAPIPWLSNPAMDVLGERDITPELAARAGEAAASNAEPMAENEYKVQLVKVAVKRALLAAAGLETPSWT